MWALVASVPPASTAKAVPTSERAPFSSTATMNTDRAADAATASNEKLARPGSTMTATASPATTAVNPRKTPVAASLRVIAMGRVYGKTLRQIELPIPANRAAGGFD